jgi:5-methyltetrahydropteroyltriglutamate--homocysteine methyltransferase
VAPIHEKGAAMKRSTEHILTTHTGSLPRPPELVPMIFAKEKGELEDEALFDTAVKRAVADIVTKQVNCGVTVVNDGEQGKVSYANYVQNRLAGFDGPLTVQRLNNADTEFPDFAEIRDRWGKSDYIIYRRPCTGPISYKNVEELHQELADFRAALDAARTKPEDAFLTAASPGIASLFIPNEYYQTHEEYLFAIAAAMKTEYDAIHQAGFVLQVDTPDLALSRPGFFGHLSLEEFRKVITTHVEALNEATRDIPPEDMRMHICWGNGPGPHTKDVPFKDIVDIVLQARPAALSFEAANPRHEHEYVLWEDVKLPDGKVLIPGVLDSLSNYVEHPELIAQRIVRFAERVGRENVIAGSDCGFATGASSRWVAPSITWAKFRAMAEGAEIATKALW